MNTYISNSNDNVANSIVVQGLLSIPTKSLSKMKTDCCSIDVLMGTSEKKFQCFAFSFKCFYILIDFGGCLEHFFCVFDIMHLREKNEGHSFLSWPKQMHEIQTYTNTISVSCVCCKRNALMRAYSCNHTNHTNIFTCTYCIKYIIFMNFHLNSQCKWWTCSLHIYISFLIVVNNNNNNR